jgi:hypothetical protein
MKKRLAIAALLALVAAGEPPAASDVVWETVEVPKGDVDTMVTAYTVPAGRAFLLREAQSNGSLFSVWRVRGRESVRVTNVYGSTNKWTSEVGVPFQPGDKVQLKVPPAGGMLSIGGVLTKP